LLLVVCQLLTREYFQQQTLIDNSGGAPLFGLSPDAINSLRWNNNMGFFPATHFKRPSFRQCLDYAYKIGKGKLTEEANTKLIMCVQQAGMRPWIKNLPISSPGV